MILPSRIWGKRVSLDTSPTLHFPLAFTTKNFLCTVGATITSQTVAGNDWYLQVCDIKTTKSGRIILQVEAPILLLIYSLKSTTELSGNNFAWSWPVNQYRMVSLTKGKYNLQVNKGDTSCLFIKPPINLWEVTKHPDIKNHLFSFSDKPQSLNEAPIHKTVSTVLQRLRKIDPMKNQLTAKIFTIIMALLANYDKALHNKEEVSERPYSHAIAIAVMQYISERLFQPGISNMQKICTEFYISPKTLRKSFITLTGLTVVQWVKEKRMEKAWELVMQTTESIATIADSIGYSEPNNMLRDFIAKYGQSPTTLRNKKS